MEAVRRVEGTAVPLDRSDVDTDQIVPAQFLKRIERTGFGPFLFHEWRKDPSFVLNDDRYAGASILLAGPNFGSGSSREHAPWALEDYGFRAVIAPSFADIFRNNCAKNGLLTVILPAARCRELIALATEDPRAQIRIDLPQQTVVTSLGTDRFEIDAHTKHLLVAGLDTIDLTLQRDEQIADFESRRPTFMPAAS
jgi:3-isopropylmalate/(R)-2-methylmalate dehydratase small subunit